MQSEIPALLQKSGDFTIDGVQKSLISGSGNVAEQIDHVLAQSTLQTNASKVTSP